jgi:anti-sigma-K factor RskA
MRPTDRNLIDRLASEYVLGTLRGRARRRFERWRATVPLVEERCVFWENRLVHLAKGITPATPPPHVWDGIRKRLGLSQRSQRRSLLRTYALAASVLFVAVLGSILYWEVFGPQRPTEFAAISVPSGARAWTVEVYGRNQRLTVRTGTLPSKAADRVFELWALPDGGQPVSLGVLPGTGVSQHALTTIQQQALAKSTKVAVSVEPTGGSPTGLPTGAVIFVVPLQTG